MPAALDQTDLLVTFKTEADEYLAKLTQGLLALEKDANQPEVIAEMFRAAHTIKGAAAMIGCDAIKHIAHDLEETLRKIKDGELTFTSPIADRSLKALDAISAILEGKEPAPSPVAEASTSAAAHAAATIPATPAPARADEFIRLPISRVDTLFNLVGELVVHRVKSSYKLANLRQLTQQVKISHKRLTQLVEHSQGNTAAGAAGLAPLLHQHVLEAETLKRQALELAELFSAETLHLDPVIDDLQYKVRTLRMLPCSTIFDGFERLVRDVSRQLGKEVRLVVEGEDTELDKKALESIKPCLVHVLRNAVDHGLESPADRAAAGKPAAGTVRLRASQEGGKAVIEVQDDGHGINTARIKEVALKRHVATAEELARMDDAELMNLIFAPGFSTAQIITDVSGRGVGMDVVKREVEALKGHVEVHSQPGQGTTIRIELPLTVAIMKVLLVEAHHQRFGLPVLSVQEILKVKPADVQTLNGRMAFTLRDRTLPLVRLHEVLGLPNGQEEVTPTDWSVVVASVGERRVGLLVDRVAGEEEIFIKNLGAHLGTLKNVGGAAILGTGEVIVILDVLDLFTASRTFSHAPTVAAAPAAKCARRILIAEDSLTTREFERGLLEAEGYQVETAVDGLDALDKVTRGKFDLVVSDIEMPRMNGFEFCQNLRQRAECQALPLIFVTTLARDEDKRRGIEVGAQAYIVKSAFNQNSLLEAITRLLGPAE